MSRPLSIPRHLTVSVTGNICHHCQFSPSSWFLFHDGIRLYVARSYTSTPDSVVSLISSLTLSHHLLLGLPLLLCTSTSIALHPTQCFSIHITYHFNLLSWTFIEISPSFVVSLIRSCHILSSFVNLHIIVAFAFLRPLIFFLFLHVSAP